MPRKGETTRGRIVDALRRRGPCTVTELARRFGLSSMAVRLHLRRMQRDGLARPAGTRPSRGRPAHVYALSPAARRLFPERSGALAVETLEEVEAIAGRDLVIRALEERAERVLEGYRPALDGAGAAERVRALSRLRDGEGYLCDAEDRGDALPQIVEHHCPIQDVARRWPEVCRIEADLLHRALGMPVERVEHMLSGDSCCRYRVGRPV